MFVIKIYILYFITNNIEKQMKIFKFLFLLIIFETSPKITELYDRNKIKIYFKKSNFMQIFRKCRNILRLCNKII